MIVYLGSGWVLQTQETERIPGRKDVKPAAAASPAAARTDHVQVAIVNVAEAGLSCFMNIHLLSCILITQPVA